MKPPSPSITIAIHAATEAEIRSGVLGLRLRQFNYGFAGDYGPAQVIRLDAHDAEGNLLGGARAHVALEWLTIDILYVDEGSRGARLGSKLLCEAERIAKDDMGAHSAKLQVLEWQSANFFRNHGYREFGRIDSFVGGYWMSMIQKRL